MQCQISWAMLIREMSCPLFDAKPVPEPVLYHQKHTSVKLHSIKWLFFKKLYFKRLVAKCRSFCSGPNVLRFEVLQQQPDTWCISTLTMACHCLKSEPSGAIRPPQWLRSTHWGRDKTAIFQTTFSNAFSWMKCANFDWDFIEVCS